MNQNLKKMTNKELIQSALKSIEDIGFHVTDVNTGNTYFIFSGEDDSICHFHIKEIPGFLFAFWLTGRFDKLEERMEWCNSLDIDTKSELIFFTQYSSLRKRTSLPGVRSDGKMLLLGDEST